MNLLNDQVTVVGGGTGSVGDEASVQRFRNELLERVGRVDLAIACLGGWYYGYSLHRMPFSDWERVLLNNLTTHFLFMRAVLSFLHDQNHGTYVMINGGAADVIAPESGMISIVAAAQRMMARVLAEEARAENVRVYSVTAESLPISRRPSTRCERETTRFDSRRRSRSTRSRSSAAPRRARAPADPRPGRRRSACVRARRACLRA